jgi:hypothetical protein
MSWRNEPLLHFAVLGAALFAVHAVVSGPSSPETDKTIRISAGDVRRLAAAWELQWRRPPTKPELDSLVEEHVREEILYREALAMGLDRDDSIVRRRLAQKMQFLAEDTAESEPSEAELRRFFEERPELFAKPERLTFEHFYFSRDVRGERAASDAEDALAAMREGARPSGDRSALQARYAEQSREQVAALFGASFAERAFALPLDAWHGPLESGYGLHLVRVEAREAPRLPEFRAVRAQVRELWLDENRLETNERVYERLRAAYSVEVEKPE